MGGSTGDGQRVVVALGKFDALHLGHRSLAVAAARELNGTPYLLSFSGMAEVKQSHTRDLPWGSFPRGSCPGNITSQRRG